MEPFPAADRQPTGLPVEKLQQVGFRLIVTNSRSPIMLLPQLPVAVSTCSRRYSTNGKRSSPTHVSQSFLQNLVGFLKV